MTDVGNRLRVRRSRVPPVGSGLKLRDRAMTDLLSSLRLRNPAIQNREYRFEPADPGSMLGGNRLNHISCIQLLRQRSGQPGPCKMGGRRVVGHESTVRGPPRREPGRGGASRRTRRQRSVPGLAADCQASSCAMLGLGGIVALGGASSHGQCTNSLHRSRNHLVVLAKEFGRGRGPENEEADASITVCTSRSLLEATAFLRDAYVLTGDGSAPTRQVRPVLPAHGLSALQNGGLSTSEPATDADRSLRIPGERVPGPERWRATIDPWQAVFHRLSVRSSRLNLRLQGT